MVLKIKTSYPTLIFDNNKNKLQNKRQRPTFTGKPLNLRLSFELLIQYVKIIQTSIKKIYKVILLA